METSLQSIDWIVVGLYFALMVAVGLAASRGVTQTADYFLGHRSFNVWLVIGQALGVGTHAEMPVSLAGKVYQSGYAGIWYQWKNLFITPFYWILAPLFRRFRRTTTGEVYEDRYGEWMGAVISLPKLLAGAAGWPQEEVGGATFAAAADIIAALGRGKSAVGVRIRPLAVCSIYLNELCLNRSLGVGALSLRGRKGTISYVKFKGGNAQECLSSSAGG